ncbi:hypothetical protein OOT46_25445 [Aquabacterium sp. A7-Y]|uniref:hypothetical protein n=1 Tax=Aquabacterium sp. A7-Y TaxID=1349605 RepID=UPI00223E3C35|nr:hypothetical protein [Aquabacterium sp. A7-Y]MCW7541161.1 hypothetical protein [Aquabacterium sp. A7-Y]
MFDSDTSPKNAPCHDDKDERSTAIGTMGHRTRLMNGRPSPIEQAPDSPRPAAIAGQIRSAVEVVLPILTETKLARALQEAANLLDSVHFHHDTDEFNRARCIAMLCGISEDLLSGITIVQKS